jgi:hypothetical protein
VLAIAAACGGGTGGSTEERAKGQSGAPPPVLELLRWQKPRELVRFRPTGGEIGPAAGPFAARFYAGRGTADDLSYFRRTFAPFRARLPEGELTFRGGGPQPSGAVEQRMITEWARATADDLAGGDGRSYGLAFTWHAGGAMACEDLSVFLTGVVLEDPCPGSGGARARLEPGALARLYAWFDALAPFQTAPLATPGPGLETAPRLVFAGRGGRSATAAERAEIGAFGERLAAELRARQPAATGGAALAGPVLLLPPELAAGGRATAVVPQLPESAPPPPPPNSGP